MVYVTGANGTGFAATYFRGRVALAAILRNLGIGRGDAVALPAFTCVAVPEAIMALGARPFWLDVDAVTLSSPADEVRRALAAGVRAVLVQHTFGLPADMDAILPLTAAAGVPVVEDCCHTLGSTLHGRMVGTFGAAAFYSFEWGKPLVAGVGGAASARGALGERLAAEAVALVPPPPGVQVRLELQRLAYALLYRPRFYWTIRGLFRRATAAGLAVGNYHPVDSADLSPEFGWAMAPRSAARLRRLLDRQASDSQRRRLLAAAYRAALPGGVSPASVPGADPVLLRYPLLVDDKPAVLARAAEQRVELAGWFATPVHPLAGDSLRQVGYEPGQAPRAEALAARIVSLPMNGLVGPRDVDAAARLFGRTGS